MIHMSHVGFQTNGIPKKTMGVSIQKWGSADWMMTGVSNQSSETSIYWNVGFTLFNCAFSSDWDNLANTGKFE